MARRQMAVAAARRRGACGIDDVGVARGKLVLRRSAAALESGDVLIMRRLDRLARSTRDLLNTLATITSARPGSIP